MRRVSTATVSTPTEVDAPERFWNRERRLGLGITIIGLLATVVFGALAEPKAARFTLSTDASGAALSIDGQFGTVLFGLLTLALGVVMLTGRAPRWQAALLSLGIAAFVLSFLCWQVAGKFLPLVDTMSGSLEYALPLILGALAGVLGERSGVVNVAIEGQFLMGAFGAALVGTLATSVWAGLVSAMSGAGQREILVPCWPCWPSASWSTRSWSASC